MGNCISVLAVGANRELLSLRMSIQHLPSEFSSLKNLQHLPPTTFPASLKDYITVIKASPDRKGLAGYPEHPLLVQGFCLRLGSARCGFQCPERGSFPPFPGEAVLQSSSSHRQEVFSDTHLECSLLQLYPITARPCLCTAPPSPGSMLFPAFATAPIKTPFMSVPPLYTSWFPFGRLQSHVWGLLSTIFCLYLSSCVSTEQPSDRHPQVGCH